VQGSPKGKAIQGARRSTLNPKPYSQWSFVNLVQKSNMEEFKQLVKPK